MRLILRRFHLLTLIISNTKFKGVYSQVHYVQKSYFVGNLWRLANLYIFGKLTTWGTWKGMFSFAQMPLWPPFFSFKMGIFGDYFSWKVSGMVYNLLDWLHMRSFSSNIIIHVSCDVFHLEYMFLVLVVFWEWPFFKMAAKITNPPISQRLLVRFSFCLACWIANRNVFKKCSCTFLV